MHSGAGKGAMTDFFLAYDLPDEALSFTITGETGLLPEPQGEELTLEPPVLQIPLSVYSQDNSALQATVRYLHDRLSFPFARIARILNRDQRTVWSSYRQSKPLELPLDTALLIPVSIFSDRRYSMLESLVGHMAGQGKGVTEIGRLLGKDPRTIGTVKHRLARKHGTEDR